MRRIFLARVTALKSSRSEFIGGMLRLTLLPINHSKVSSVKRSVSLLRPQTSWFRKNLMGTATTEVIFGSIPATGEGAWLNLTE